MKKWCVTAKKDSVLTVFLSSESLYEWLVDGARYDALYGPEYEDFVQDIRLKKGDEVYVEWLGSEYFYDDKEDRTHALKTIKLVSKKPIQSELVPIGMNVIEECWISDEMLRLSDKSERDVSDRHFHTGSIGQKLGLAVKKVDEVEQTSTNLC